MCGPIGLQLGWVLSEATGPRAVAGTHGVRADSLTMNKRAGRRAGREADDATG